MLLLLLAVDRSRKRLPLLVVGGLAGFATYATWVGMEAVTARLIGVAREPFGDLRWTIWQATVRMALETPVFGVGLGAYQDAFTRFRPTVVPADKLVDFAHNDYLQLLAETGVVGFGLLAWALVGLAVFVVRRLVLRRDPLVKGLTIGALCALAVAAFHSVLDFGLHRPANAILVVATAAIVAGDRDLAGASDRRSGGSPGMALAPRRHCAGPGRCCGDGRSGTGRALGGSPRGRRLETSIGARLGRTARSGSRVREPARVPGRPARPRAGRAVGSKQPSRPGRAG